MAGANIAKLKKKASDFEQKKQFDRALSLYIQLLEEAGRDLDDADLQLYNRVGDLLQRQGNLTEALAYYEKAVDVYAERGFLNNAIALCNKVLRQSPARTSVYYKLGKISATKGFKSDAKKNFLEYAERMQKSGHLDEAFRALKEFADLCPDQDDIRLMLADWLQKENRKLEAVEQLETLYTRLEAQGREAEARATIDRIKSIDPNVVPRSSGSFVAQKTNDLVFLDLADEATESRSRETPAADQASEAGDASSAPVVGALEGLILTFNPDEQQASVEGETEAERGPIDGFEATASATSDDPAPESLSVDGLETAEVDATTEAASSVDATLEVVRTMEDDSWREPDDPVPHIDGLESPRAAITGTSAVLSPLIDGPPMSGEEFGVLPLRGDHDAVHPAASARATHDLALPSTLPLLIGDAPANDALQDGDPSSGEPTAEGRGDDAAALTIDLLSLPPIGDAMASSARLEWPVTGSLDPLDMSREAPLGDGEGSNDARVIPHTQRDTAELVAQDGTSRTTDEILVVPSEVIDEETRRSLRLEFALDGDETPDAWIEAALGATDDRSLDQFLTPAVPLRDAPDDLELPVTGVQAHAPAGPAGDASPDDAHASAPDAESLEAEAASAQGETANTDVLSPADESTTDSEENEARVESLEEAFARLSHGYVSSESAADPSGEVDTTAGTIDGRIDDRVDRTADEAAASAGDGDEPKLETGDGAEKRGERSSEFDLLDELLPPFMRHDGEATRAADVATGEALASELAAGSRDAGEASESGIVHAGDAGDAGDAGVTEGSLASALDVDGLRALLVDKAGAHEGTSDAAEIDVSLVESAFTDGDPGLPLLDVDDLMPPSGGSFAGPLDFDAVDSDDILGGSPSFGDSSIQEFVPEPLFSSEMDSQVDDVAAEDRDATADAAGAFVGDGASSESDDEWSDDDAPEVLINGDWHDERMGDLMSGEVRAIRAGDHDAPSPRTPRFDDLAAALMWPAPEDRTDGIAPPDDLGMLDASFFIRLHTPRSTLSFGGVEAQLRRRLELDGTNHALRRQLGEALLDQGSREEGLHELEVAMSGFEQAGDLERARGIADIILRVEPSSVRHHQKRVEYAVRSNDRVRLVEAYVALADSLLQSAEPDKARVVYSRVLELSPGNGRARQALGMLRDAERAALEAEPSQAGAAPRTPSPADMVSMFDRAIPQARTEDQTAILAELPVIADGLFAAEAPVVNEAGDSRWEDRPCLDVDEVLAVGDELRRQSEDVATVTPAGSEGDAPAAAVSTRSGAVGDGPSDALLDAPAPGEEAADDPDGEEFEVYLSPIPTPSLDEQIDAAFATPPIVEGAGAPPTPAAGHEADYHDSSATPPLGAAAFATPFPSTAPFAAASTPAEDPAVAGTRRGEADVASPMDALPPVAFGAAGTAPDVTAPRTTSAPRGGDDDFVDLGSWLHDDEPVRSTRMVTAEAAPSGDEQADFDEMLRRFKQGLAENVEDEDFDSHYDLGVAFKEMGLMDEAIAEFQKSLRGESHRIRSFEALGQCFVEKGQFDVAATMLQRALETTRADDQQLVGVLYLLGYASEVLARHADALRYYQRVFAVDIEFRDVAQRVAAMEPNPQ